MIYALYFYNFLANSVKPRYKDKSTLTISLKRIEIIFISVILLILIIIMISVTIMISVIVIISVINSILEIIFVLVAAFRALCSGRLQGLQGG